MKTAPRRKSPAGSGAREDLLDGRIRHAFTCICAGPSGSGKSTFVRNLLRRQGDLIDVVFDYIIIVMGTSLTENPLMTGLMTDLGGQDVKVIALRDKYPSLQLMSEQFPDYLRGLLRARSDRGQVGCLVFDDLMVELSHCGILTDLFTKYSSHFDISIIHTTQNLFHQGGGKHRTDHTTVYRNTHVIVLFRSPLDNTILSTVAKRINPSRHADLVAMWEHMMDRHRYVVIFGQLDRPESLRYATDIFATEPLPHQRIFHLKGGREPAARRARDGRKPAGARRGRDKSGASAKGGGTGEGGL